MEDEPRLTPRQEDGPTLAEPEPEPGPSLTGTVLLDRYRVNAKIGAGGMGTVYLGEHTTIGKEFAIKVLSNEYAHRKDLVERFLREARAASMIRQQNVVEITDYGDTPEGSVFFVMEFLDGEDLGALLAREQRVPWDRVRHLMIQVCRALEAAHAAGIIHRDMKPDNCFRIERGKDPDFIKVLDFGIAKIESGEQGGKPLTQTGMIFGTPEYMSPEQAQGDKVDHRVDIYAVGVIMYELLCGRPPFEGSTFMAILTKHMFEVPEAPSKRAPDAGIPPEAEAIVLKAMQKDRAYRFQTMTEMIAAIEAVGTGAGAVEVVQESIARPEGGPTGFAPHQVGDGAAAVGAAAVGAGVEAAPTQRSGRKLIAGFAGLALVAAVVGYAVFGPNSQASENSPSDPVVVNEPEPEPAPEPAPEPEPAPQPVASDLTPVKLEFETNVPAQILDARDRAIFGTSDAPGGLEFELSDQPVKLILSAEGYEELEVEVVPNRESKRYQYELVEISTKPGTKPGKRPRPRPSAAPEPEPEPEPEPAASSHKLPTKGHNDGDLKNPFDN
ncbi:Serine/threonine-protein kinase Pkn1 [Enhygromyxa salina]|uniref:non-specific serine/threonine protein kinase n=2 Tax=Enhygromyxa salina TaxID=215803 RepID=A0A2S9XAZ0_9BACT|nr:Serine/threonine-protein kinase Pkn1 [Enhygromyxa salina]